MEKKIKFLILIMSLVIITVACGSNAKEDKSNKNEQESGNVNADEIVVSEDYFEWEDNYITGLTEVGRNQNTLIIPARCEGFLAKIFSDENKVEHVLFESDKNVDLNRGLSLATNLKTVKLPKELKEIGTLEFWGAKKLESVKLPAGVTVIGDRAFWECESLKEITCEGLITTIGEHAFEDCKMLSSIILPNTVTSIGDYAFYGCESLLTLSIPESVKCIGAYACAEIGVTDIYLPEMIEFTEWQKSSFVINANTITIHLVEGSWMDLHFDEIFIGSFEKKYDIKE